MPGIFAISDLHLPIQIQVKKFGYPADYFERVRDHLAKFNPDLLLIVGDFSWESNFKRGMAILKAVEELPGSKKIFIEGNHDKFCHDEEQRSVLRQLFNDESYYYLSGRALILNVRISEDDDSKRIGLCGTMGWMLNQRSFGQDDLILFHRQLDLMKLSLDELENRRAEDPSDFNICLVHHPPTYDIYTDRRYGDESFFNLIKEYKFINAVVYGHIHVEQRFKIYKRIGGIDLYCSAVDQLGFKAIRLKV